MNDLRIAGLRVNYQEAVERKYNRPLLFVHGMWAGNWTWAGFMEYFSRHGWDCYAPNLRGHYESKTVANLGKVSISDYVSDIKEVIEWLEVSPIIMGHSLGGLIAQKIAEQGMARAAVFICSVPPKGIPFVGSPILTVGQMRYLPKLLFKKPFLPSYNLVSRSVLNTLNETARKEVYQKMVPDSGLASWEASRGKIEINENLISCPMLVIAAKNDKLISWKTACRLADKYGAELKLFSNHGHFIIGENDWQVADEIKEWIQTND